jgi:hypothetical protein
MGSQQRGTKGGIYLIVLAFLLGLVPAKAQQEKRPGPAVGTLKIGTETGKVVALTTKEWAKLPRQKVEVKGKGDKAVTYEGVSLAEVLQFAGMDFGKHPRGGAAAYVVIEGTDGYRALLALAEVDPKVTTRMALLADKLDGKPLSERDGPYRLIVPGDKLPSRWVKQVARVSSHRHPEPTPPKK